MDHIKSLMSCCENFYSVMVYVSNAAVNYFGDRNFIICSFFSHKNQFNTIAEITEVKNFERLNYVFQTLILEYDCVVVDGVLFKLRKVIVK